MLSIPSDSNNWNALLRIHISKIYDNKISRIFFQNVAKDNPNITLNMFSIFFSLFQLRSIRSWSRKYQFAQMRSTNFPQIWTVPSSLEISAAVEREGADSRNFHRLQWSDFTKAVGIHARKVSYLFLLLFT